VIDACQRHRIPKLVFTSSPSVTFDGRDQNGVDESVPYAKRWLAWYPKTKALAEQAVLKAHDPPRFTTCALRPHLIWGPGDRHLIPRLLARSRKGQLARIGNGRNCIDTVYIDNAARAHLDACHALGHNHSAGGRAYFISQGQPVNCWEWINQILAVAGLPPVRRAISYRTAWSIGTALEGIHWLCRSSREPRMTRFLAAQLATSHYFDTSAARRELAFTPTVSMDEGMQRLASSL
jgi:nucleoside-diphosphate-sugar epimerase